MLLTWSTFIVYFYVIWLLSQTKLNNPSHQTTVCYCDGFFSVVVLAFFFVVARVIFIWLLSCQFITLPQNWVQNTKYCITNFKPSVCFYWPEIGSCASSIYTDNSSNTRCLYLSHTPFINHKCMMEKIWTKAEKKMYENWVLFHSSLSDHMEFNGSSKTKDVTSHAK